MQAPLSVSSGDLPLPTFVSGPVTNLRSRPILLRDACYTPITGFTPAMAASFTTPVLHMDSGADRWKSFLLQNSPTVTRYGFGPTHPASRLAKYWSARSRGWASAAIGS